ncbi:MAG TPA: heavy metal-responsive transcriptional regulator [Thermoanaerobaculia bacterium]
MTTGQLARLCGVSPDTIRHYERCGVIPSATRGENGYRSYPAEALERVRIVRRALTIGFSLEELARIFRERDGGRAPCRKVRALAGEKLAELERRIEEMLLMRDELARLVEEWDERLAGSRDGEPVRLLESIGKGEPTHASRTHALPRPRRRPL